MPWLAGHPLYRALINIECHWRQREVRTLISDTERLARAEDLIRLRNASTIRTVERLHNQQIARLNEGYTPTPEILRDDEGNPRPFPAPPLADSEHIKAITTPKGLAAEGEQLRHCVKIYTSKVQRGQYYVYHMDQPEILTIGIRMRSEQLSLDQICGDRNVKPSTETLELIQKWFAEAVKQRRIFQRGA